MATVFFGKILQSFYSNDKFMYDSILGKLEKKNTCFGCDNGNSISFKRYKRYN